MAIALSLETPTVLAKSDIFIPKCIEGGSIGLGNIPNKYQFLFSASLSSKFKVKWNFLREEYTVVQCNKSLNTAVKLYFDKVGNMQSYSNVLFVVFPLCSSQCEFP